MAEHTREAFLRADVWRSERPDRALILDSGCGTGRSSVRLAKTHPDSLVIGIDQSAARLMKSGSDDSALPKNLLLLRAECADFWRLAADCGWQLQRHYLLYPNPWPKSAHVKRRWHGHPVFPVMLALGGQLELRTNWRVYADEMARALKLADRPAATEELVVTDEPLSDFERKYRDSSHQLYRLMSNLSK